MKKLVGICALLLLSACESTPEKNPLAEQINQLAAQVEMQQQQLDSWQTREAGVDRLLLIEQDLSLLITQLAELKAQLEKEKADLIKAQSMPVEQPKTETSVIPAATPLEPQAVGYALQVGSVSNTEQAHMLLRQVQSKAGRVVANMQVNTESVQVNGKSLLRLKLGYFADKSAALTQCEALQAFAVNCFVAPYVASPLMQ